VYSRGLEESVQKFLEMLGKLNRSYLTNLEGKVLSFLESEILAEWNKEAMLSVIRCGIKLI